MVKKKNIAITAALFFVLIIVMTPVSFALTIYSDSIKVDAKANSAVVSWRTDAYSDSEVVYGKDTEHTSTIPGQSSTREHSVELTNLDPSERYYYLVRSSVYEQNSKTSAERGYFKFETLPEKVTGLAVESKQYNEVKIKWNSNPKVYKYNIYKDNSFVGSTSYSYYTIKGLQGSTSYKFQVAGQNSEGKEGQKSDVLTVLTPKEPAVITAVRADEIMIDKAVIAWHTSNNEKCTVLYSKDGSFNKNFVENSEKKEHSITLTGLDKDTEYNYKVKCGQTESRQYKFRTLSESQSKIKITNIRVNEITSSSATILWDTTEATKGIVKYGETKSLGSEKEESSTTKHHEVKLTGLKKGKTYYYKVGFGYAFSAIKSFSVQGSGGKHSNFLSITTKDKIVNHDMVNITGTAKAGSKVFIYVNGKDTAQKILTLKTSSFKAEVRLSSSANYGGIKGRNFIKVYAISKDKGYDTKSLYIVLDNEGPDLAVNPIPGIINKRSINISGSTEPNTTVRFYIKSRKTGEIKSDAKGFFSYKFNLGRDGKYNLTVAAVDSAGNENKKVFKVNIDRSAPKIKFVSEFKTTHFKLFKIKGITEPNAKVTVVNHGQYTGCDDPGMKSRYFECDKFLKENNIRGYVDFVSMIFGKTSETTADSSGEFTLTVSLLPGDRNKPAVNHLQFFVEDEAGNINDRIRKSVTYKPGCPEWTIAKVDSYPFNLYYNEMKEGNIEGNAIIQLAYSGVGEPDIYNIRVYKDDSVRGYLLPSEKKKYAKLGKANTLTVGIENNNKMFRIHNPKASNYDSATDKVYVNVPMTISRYTGNIDALPDQLNAYLGIQISYKTADGSNTCDVYPTLAFDIQKPEKIIKWLSPEMMNKTIKNLDKIINKTKKLVNVLNDASRAGLLACGAMIAYQYTSGLFGTKDAEECSDNSIDMEMKNVYYVCDRVLCPSVPPKCNSFKTEDGSITIGGKFATDEQLKKQKDINEKWYKAYEDYKKKKGNGKLKFDKFLTVCNKNEKPSECNIQGSYKPIDSVGYAGEVNGEKLHITEYYINDNYKTSFSSMWMSDDGRINKYLKDRFLKEASRCQGGTLIVVEKSANKEGMFGGKSVERTIESIECVPGKKIDQYPLDFSSLKGCYKKGCPKFDETKCFDVDDINPAEGLWSSAKCACIPGMLNHVKNYLKIMIGAKKCLQQAMIGETTGGHCERLLAQFVCDLLIEAVKYVLKTPTVSASTGNNRGILADFKENSQRITKSLSSRYNGVFKQKAGLSTDQIVHKACMFGITQDWSMLDEFMDNIANHVEVEPVASISAESRPYGFDPFNGRMSIGYTFFVGIVPGGETEIEAWMECDRNYPGHEFCGNNVPRKRIRNIPSHMTQDDDLYQETIRFVDSNALYWYNKVTLTLTYKVGGKTKTKTIVEPIKRKGTLAYSCTFSMVNGISCSGPEVFSPLGFAELVRETHISPKVPLFYSGNNVGALVKIRNIRKDTLYLRVDYNDKTKKPIEYEIPASDENPHEYYLIWLYSFGEKEKKTAESNAIYSFEPENVNLNLGDNSIVSMSSIDNADWVVLKIDRKYDDDKDISFICFFTLNDGIKKENIEDYYSGSIQNSNDFKKCILSADGDFAEEEKREMSAITKITLVDAGYKDNENKKIGDPVIHLRYGNNREHNHKFKREVTNENKYSNTRKVTLTLVQETDDGRKPILYDNKEQRLELTFHTTTAKPNGKKQPRIDFIEPVSEYMPKDDAVPIGITAWDDLNEIKRIIISIKGEGKSSFACSYEWPSDENSCSIRYNNERSMKSDGKPLFYEFLWKPDVDKGPDSIYYITITAIDDKGKKSVPMTKKFRFDQNGDITFEDDIVCLGSGNCNEWENSEIVDYDLSKPKKLPKTTAR